jgi:hypothetical protein
MGRCSGRIAAAIAIFGTWRQFDGLLTLLAVACIEGLWYD